MSVPFSYKRRQKAASGRDDYQTPPYAVAPLLPYLRRDWRIWEPAQGKGYMVNALRSHGLRVVGSDVKTGVDFLGRRLERFDAVVTNPPYSLKTEFVIRCYELRKPWALLLPLYAFDVKACRSLFRSQGVSVLIPDRRVNYETPHGRGSSADFLSCWFTWGLSLPSSLTFASLAG